MENHDTAEIRMLYTTDDLARRKLVSKVNRNLKEAVNIYGCD